MNPLELFCDSCGYFLEIVELRRNNENDVYMRCKGCGTEEKYAHHLIQEKNYRTKTQRHISKHINKHKSKDITIASKKTTCKHCGSTNENRYENLYADGKFFKNNICSSCYSSF